ncbi:hypothetical protein BGW39_010940 [Mortierella sp. 14UC]|nr:hypothetical protein BGW39_010940 [Mortierella sp. 14UC]
MDPAVLVLAFLVAVFVLRRRKKSKARQRRLDLLLDQNGQGQDQFPALGLGGSGGGGATGGTATNASGKLRSGSMVGGSPAARPSIQLEMDSLRGSTGIPGGAVVVDVGGYDHYGYPQQQPQHVHHPDYEGYEGYNGYGGHVPYGGQQDQFDQYDPYYEPPAQPGQFYPPQQQQQQQPHQRQQQQTYRVGNPPSAAHDIVSSSPSMAAYPQTRSASPRTPQPGAAEASAPAVLNHDDTAVIAEKGDYATDSRHQMEVNKDEALRCLDIARRHLLTGNYTSARKFGQKSISLFPTSDARAFISLVDAKEAAAAINNNSSNASSSTASSPGPSSTSFSSTPNTGAGTGARAGTGATPPLNRSKSTPIPDHKPVERDYTPEQAAAVKAIRSSGGDFYKVLGVKKDATDFEIKKAYRKVALQMHPDKNGAPGADEAFKVVSKAFTVLSDPQKRTIFDQHGPEDGRSSGVNYDRARPTAQQYYSRGAGGGGVYGEEISPEEIFNMFFGGGGFGGSFQSGGYGARTRAQQAQHHHARQEQFRRQHQQQRQQRQNSQNNQDFNLGSLIQLLPLILLIIVSMTSGLFGSSDSSSSGSNSVLNDFSLRPREQYTTARHTTQRNVPYYVDEIRFMNTYFPGQQFEFKSSSAKQINVKPDQVTLQGRKVGRLFQRMEENVENSYLREMQDRCRNERRKKEIARNKAMGFWGVDPKLWQEAQRMSTPSCDVVKEKFSKMVL